ncbi:MAG: hypothetical protein EZS28_022610 [Streblomastix strix]|uniref:Tyr recombinase domain-containing protein n=1 Tax=Streblomastix strix TaxID=222440 RepID=A0A5J4VHR0_9EUKA|nr:MAG: hypothetical protein EZS28_022610 [Streblomastix strix]
MQEKKIQLGEIFKARPDVILNCTLTREERKECNGALEEIRKLKTHIGVAFSLFSDIRDVVQSPMVQTIVSRLSLMRSSKVKYTIVWNLNQLLTSIANSEMNHGRRLMRKSIALLVTFSGARMTELAAIQRKDIVDSRDKNHILYNNQEGQNSENKEEYIKNKRWALLSYGSDEGIVAG